MKARNLLNRWLLPIPSALWMTLAAGTVLAQEEAAQATSWRPVYDDVMLVVNFCILVFILVRLGKEPLKKFLASKRDEVAQELDRLEQEKAQALAQVEETKRLIAEGDQHLARIRERIIAEGEKTKNRIIETARTESAFLMEAAKRRVTGQSSEAQAALRAEFIDAAMEIVARRLPQEVSPQDHQRQVERFFDSLNRSKSRLADPSASSR